ncbi:hypothetical protein ACFYXF_47905 [Streptomyces sp. NPDC002680]|uniref:hypothetical protein n=1 Tax=Streptomyces sp. NPDC002680 TaxID=3364659 RepID=UPI0036BD2392
MRPLLPGGFAAVTPVLGRPTRTASVASVEDGLATLALTVALDDGTITLLGDAVVALD